MQRRAVVAAAGLAAALQAGPAAASARAEELAALTLEQLQDVVVSTVSRRDERLAGVAASVYVITAEDIRRAGAVTLPEALRLAPTLDVARADANQVAISARGFTNVLANKLLVLVDGRTLYTPLFSGVFWEAQETVLEDVERIEVVTGPSTALWGTNAVNGLIHVITRQAAQTQGPAASLHAGTDGRVAAVRLGQAAGPHGHWRAWAKAWQRDETRRADGRGLVDAADGAQLGFRADWAPPGLAVTLQGEALRGSSDQPTQARRYQGAFLQTRVQAELGGGARLTVQGSLERTERVHPQVFDETRDTLDLVAEVGWHPLPRHRVLLGAGWRESQDRTAPFAALAFVPAQRRLRWRRLFVQDQVQLSDRWTGTAAVSVEHNPFTGSEALPSVRLAYEPWAGHLGWASLSRAVRAPSRIDREFFQPASPPHAVAGGPDFVSEVSTVAEVGWRAQPSPAWSWSLTAYHHAHDRLRSLAPTPEGLQFRNDIGGRTRGLEAWTRWRAGARWRLDGGLVLQRVELGVRPGGVDSGGLASLGNDPRHWWSLRSSLELAPGLSWELGLRRVGQRPQPAVPAYTALDSRLAWRVAPEAELALVLRNLGDPGHPEWGPAANRGEQERSAALQLRWHLP